MHPNRKTAGILIAASLVITFGITSVFSQTPVNLRVESVVGNRHVLSFTPAFCWDYTGSQTNWQIQVDDDPNFTLNLHQATPQVWFWDSGDQDKGTANDDRCATLRGITKTGFVAISLDRRPHIIYWRLRLYVGGSWGPWIASDLRMNQYPLMSENLAIAADPVSSIDPVDPVPAKVTGRTLYVSTSGNDANAGTQAAPYRTIGFATRALTKGDTLLVRGGIYNENVYIYANGGYASGEPNNPITVKAYTGETPVIRAVASGTRTSLTVEGPSSRISDWVFDGLTIGGISATTGILISGAKSITVKNCRFENTVTVNTLGMVIAFSSEDIRVTGCIFDQPLFDQIELGAARHVEIRNNEFTKFNSRHCIHAHGGSANNIIIADNYFHDGYPFEGTIFLYLGTQGSRIVNNVFATVGRRDPNDPNTDSGQAYGLLIVRGGEMMVENNTFYNIEDIAVLANEFTGFGTYRNNIFMKCGQGLRLRGGILPASSTTGAVADYNIFYQNTSDFQYPAGEEGDMAHLPTGNCLGGAPPSSLLCDPKFVNAAAYDFHLQAGSAAIDAADPVSPVPVGGGSRRDVGRFEYGAATPPYDMQSKFSVQDSTPRFTWDIVDVDNELEALFDDLPPGDVDFQTRYQVQIDPKATFDSLSQGRPMLDSGVVSSLVEGYTVPDNRSLASGEYYIRVRLWDDNDNTNRGAWSDHGFRFRVAGEPVPPYLASQVPAAGAQGVSENTTVVAHVKDDGVGVNLATIRMYVNGALITPAISGTINDYTLTYAPPAAFPTNTPVTVRITAQDFNLSPPGLDATYSFTIRDTTPPSPPANVRIIP
ncbi:MAG TPA: right-handed parallel beta-helix repeat-containing protein [Candidatus Polarisedimenticolia bacterium]|jgi:hypothetical protein